MSCVLLISSPAREISFRQLIMTDKQVLSFRVPRNAFEIADHQVKIRCEQKNTTKEDYLNRVRTYYEQNFEFSDEALKEIMRLRTRNLELWGTIDALYEFPHLEPPDDLSKGKVE